MKWAVYFLRSKQDGEGAEVCELKQSKKVKDAKENVKYHEDLL